jgi:hypothetical protein
MAFIRMKNMYFLMFPTRPTPARVLIKLRHKKLYWNIYPSEIVSTEQLSTLIFKLLANYFHGE